MFFFIFADASLRIYPYIILLPLRRLSHSARERDLLVHCGTCKLVIEFVRKFLHFRKADYDKALRAAEARRKVKIYTYIYLHNIDIKVKIHTYIYLHHIHVYIYRYMYMYMHVGKGDCGTGWRRPPGCLKLQVIFRKRATNYRALLREMIFRDKADL